LRGRRRAGEGAGCGLRWCGLAVRLGAMRKPHSAARHTTAIAAARAFLPDSSSTSEVRHLGGPLGAACVRCCAAAPRATPAAAPYLPRPASLRYLAPWYPHPPQRATPIAHQAHHALPAGMHTRAPIRECAQVRRDRTAGWTEDGVRAVPDMILPSQRSGTALPTPGPSATFHTFLPLSALQLPPNPAPPPPNITAAIYTFVQS
jgi:hypothetical protein